MIRDSVDRLEKKFTLLSYLITSAIKVRKEFQKKNMVVVG